MNEGLNQIKTAIELLFLMPIQFHQILVNKILFSSQF